jgi:Fe(3+) dicitrate transport protein
MESRVLYQYKLGKQKSSLSVGLRYFKGFTNKQQGLGNNENDANFNYLNPDDLESSDYQFNSHNLAFSAEKYL